eukprot:scaffold305893_cov19-Tisochrysis_lutea.AAC.1
MLLREQLQRQYAGPQFNGTRARGMSTTYECGHTSPATNLQCSEAPWLAANNSREGGLSCPQMLLVQACYSKHHIFTEYWQIHLAAMKAGTLTCSSGGF